MEYIPGQMEQPGESAGTNMLINGIYVANTLNAVGSNLNGTQTIALKDFRDFTIHPYDKRFSKFINLRPLAKD